MTLKDFLFLLILSSIAILGFYVGEFVGGAMAGASITLINAVTIGKSLARRTIDRMNKTLNDHIFYK